MLSCCVTITDQRQDWKQRHREMCLSEEYARCALPSCGVHVLIGYADPSRPFQLNEEATLRRMLMDAATGLAAPVLRYFCSQAHCEEGKEDHDVTMKEYHAELALKKRELHRMIDEVKDYSIDDEKQCKDCEQKIDELFEDLEHERQDHERKLSELKTDVYKSKRTLKEMGEAMKRETANLERIFRTKVLEIRLEVTRLRLLHLRLKDSIFVLSMNNEYPHS